ncbi:LemA family protein [Acidovorax sp. RAC01]|uniref:LemA family protein n=1 Tax=Acidovorax sp. RAC01 TaxID=1842533 RepID=UPI00083E7B87|nr:LemA family protein [Acidovorax sp. RAC01]AOG21916.1 lemA family protein [Acidovorax sp. RAC01]
MWSSPLFWIAVSLTVFWALGAYNRLMRLRSAVVQAFGGFDAHMQRLLALLSELAVARPPDETVNGTMDRAEDRMAALEGATVQFSASLAVARARPLHADALAALAAARGVLDACWAAAMDERAGLANPTVAAQAHAVHGPAPDSAAGDGPPADTPPVASATLHAVVPLQIRWHENVAHAGHATEAFNDAVRQYNEAVAQFPASLLARLFGFKAARGL